MQSPSLYGCANFTPVAQLLQDRIEERIVLTLKRTKGTISLAQANDAVPGPNYMLKSLWK